MPLYRAVANDHAQRLLRQWRRNVAYTLLQVCGIVAFCMTVLVWLDDRDIPLRQKWAEALWNASNLITTIGDFTPLDHMQRMFMTLAMILLVVMGGYALSKLTGILSNEDILIFRENKKLQQILSQLHDHVLVVGFSSLGHLVAESLKTAGERVLIIERDTALAEQASALGFLVICGETTDDDVLDRARLQQAKAMVITSTDPDRKLAITLLAHTLNPGLQITVTGDSTRRGALLEHAGASDVIVADRIIANALLARIGIQR